MNCPICGKKLRRTNKTGYCSAHYKRADRESLDVIKRRCLRCDKEFLAVGRHNRICPGCHEKNKAVLSPPRYQVAVRYAGLGSA